MSTWFAERFRLKRLPRGLSLLATAVFFAGCAQGLDKDLSTDVTANGNRIVLSWAEIHPWDQRLRTQPVALIAEYRQKPSGKWVKQVVDRQRGAGKRVLQFNLNDTLPSRPAGEVCLVFQVANGTLLPVRQAETAGNDTARFLYADWSMRVSRNAESDWLKRNADSKNRVWKKAERDAEASVQAATRSVERFVERMKRNGYVTRTSLQSAAQCDAISVDAGKVADAPPVPADRVEAESRKICVWRVGKGTTGYRAESPVISNLVLLAQTAEIGTDKQLRDRAALFRRERARALADMGKSYRPPIDVDAYLLLNTEATELKIRYGKGDKSVAPALLDAGLDSYFGCVTDTERHLKTMIQAWEKARRESPGRRVLLEEVLHKECRERFAQLDDAKETREEIAQEVAKLLTPKADTSNLPSLPRRSEKLNFVQCHG